MTERGMRLGQRRIDLNRLERGGHRFRLYVLCRKHAIIAQQRIRIGEPGIRRRVLRIERNGLFEIIDPFLQASFRPLVPVITPFRYRL